MVTGHFFPSRNEPPKDGRIRLTLLRHPFERAVSEYYWYRHDTDAVAGGDMAPLARNYPFDEYLIALEKKNAGLSLNVYARHLAGQLSRDVADETQMLALAKEALARYDFVGITENLADSVDFFCCGYDLPLPSAIPRLNTTSSRKAVADLDPETLQRLQQIYRLDLELYGLATVNFQSRKRQILKELIAGPVRLAWSEASTGVAADQGRSISPESRAITVAGPGAVRSLSWLQRFRLRPRAADLNSGSEKPRPRPTGRRDGSPAPAENFGNKQVEIISASISGDQSGARYVHSGEQINIMLVLRARVAVQDLTVGIAILDSMGEIAYGTNTQLLGASKSILAGRYYEVTFRCKANLNRDYYFLNASAHTGAVHTNCCFHWREHIAELDIVDSGYPQFEGYARLDPEVTWVERKSLKG
jgi:hypothetical protein